MCQDQVGKKKPFVGGGKKVAENQINKGHNGRSNGRFDTGLDEAGDQVVSPLEACFLLKQMVACWIK